MDSLARQARRLRQERCLLQHLGWAWMSVFYFGARDYFQGTGSEPNPLLGAAGELGPSSVVTKVSGGELWCGPMSCISLSHNKVACDCIRGVASGDI